jgi:hypothetical protein
LARAGPLRAGLKKKHRNTLFLNGLHALGPISTASFQASNASFQASTASDQASTASDQVSSGTDEALGRPSGASSATDRASIVAFELPSDLFWSRSASFQASTASLQASSASLEASWAAVEASIHSPERLCLSPRASRRGPQVTAAFPGRSRPASFRTLSRARARPLGRDWQPTHEHHAVLVDSLRLHGYLHFHSMQNEDSIPTKIQDGAL